METKDRIERALDNVDAIGSIATGIKMTQEEREIFRLLAEGKISGEEADRRIIEYVIDKTQR